MATDTGDYNNGNGPFEPITEPSVVITVLILGVMWVVGFLCGLSAYGLFIA